MEFVSRAHKADRLWLVDTIRRALERTDKSTGEHTGDTRDEYAWRTFAHKAFTRKAT